MSRRDRSPSPYDVKINGTGFVSPRANGAVRQSEQTPVDQLDQRRGEEPLVLGGDDGWVNGAGLRTLTADEQTRHAYYYAEAAGTDGPAGDTLGGGADGAYGPLIPGPLLTATSIGSAGEVVRDLCEFTPSGGTQIFLAAKDNLIRSSASATFATPTTRVTFNSGRLTRRFVPFNGTAGMLRMYALQRYEAIWTSLDGQSWTVIGARLEAATAVATTNDSGATYADQTSALAGGTMDLGVAGTAGAPLNTVGNGDWVLIGHTHPFQGIAWDVVNTNSTVTAVTIESWTGTGWTTVGSVSDGTSSGGVSLAGDGTMTYARPTAWVPAPLTELGAAGAGTSLSTALWWVRVSWSAALDATMTVDSVTLSVFQEGLCGAVLQDQLAVVGPDSRTIYWTRTGGATPTWLSNFDPLPAGGTAIDMVAASDTWWVLGTNHLSAVGPDGSVRSYFPEVFQGGAVDVDGAFMTVWLGKILWSLGAGRGLYLLDPSTGDLEVIGPERQFLNDTTVAPYTTAVVGDRTHRLYAGWKSPGGKGWLAGWGGYRQGQNASGVPEYDRVDAWHMLGDLRQASAPTDRTVTTMATWTASGQPYVALGTDQGEVVTFKVPQGSSPLLAGSGYAYSSRHASIVLPAWHGQDQSRKVEAYAGTLLTRNLSSTITATYSTRDFATGGSWTTQFSTTSNAAARQSLATPYAGYGLESLLDLTMGNNTTTPWIVDRLSIYQMAAANVSQSLFTIDVLVDDDVVAADGRVLPKTAEDWQTAIKTIMATQTPIAIIRGDGTTEYALPRFKGATELKPDKYGSRKQSVSLVFATAEGPEN